MDLLFWTGGSTFRNQVIVLERSNMSIPGCKIGDFLWETFVFFEQISDSSIWRQKIAIYIHRDDVPLHNTASNGIKWSQKNMEDFPTFMALGGSAAAVAQVLVWRCDQRRMSSSDSNGEAGRDAGRWGQKSQKCSV